MTLFEENSSRRRWAKLLWIPFIAAMVAVLACIVTSIVDRNRKNFEKDFRLSDGKVVHCKEISYFQCGMSMYGCNDGDHICTTNVVRLK